MDANKREFKLKNLSLIQKIRSNIMLFPDYRPRRLRRNEAFRRMVRETVLLTDHLILPLFVINGKDVKNPIPSMPGHYQLSVDNLVKSAEEARRLSVPAIMLFGIPVKKDAWG